MRQKRLSLLPILPNRPQPPNPINVPYANNFNKTIITSYSYEVVPMFFPIMQSELAKNPELNQYPGS
jgi:hypothetical protein